MKEIAKSKYQGYLWKSDKEKPIVLHGDTERGWQLDESENPFIVEGRLWDEKNRRSININYIDGKYIVKSYDVSVEELSDREIIETFIPHRIEGTGKLMFIRRWRKEEDVLCAGFEKLIPGELIFVGFEKK